MNAENITTSTPDDSPWTKEDLFADIKFAGNNQSKEIPNLPTTSHDMACRFYLHEIERSGKMPEVANFISEKLSVEQKNYSDITEFDAANPRYTENVSTSLSNTEKAAVKEYSGYRFAWINSVMRGFWDYDKMGRKTPEAEKEIRQTADKISAAIAKSPNFTEDFLTFRGTNLDAFHSYGINSKSELSNLKGQFILEQGFTSTSLTRDHSFVGQDFTDNPLRSATDIEIRYTIPSGHSNALALFDEDLSYAPSQNEVLLDRDTLSYIHQVTTAEDGHPVIDALVIPTALYDSSLQ